MLIYNSGYRFRVPYLLTIPSDFDEKLKTTEYCSQLDIPSTLSNNLPKLIELESTFDTQKQESMKFKQVIERFGLDKYIWLLIIDIYLTIEQASKLRSSN